MDVSPASATVNAGQSATYTITLTPQFGSFENSISLACSGLPSFSCSFSPASLTPGGTQATPTLTASTTAQSASLQPLENGSPRTFVYASWVGIPGLAFLGFALMNAKRREKRPRVWLLLLTLTFVLALQIACGGGIETSQFAPPSSPGTPSDTFRITISGTSGSLERSATVSLSVQ